MTKSHNVKSMLGFLKQAKGVQYNSTAVLNAKAVLVAEVTDDSLREAMNQKVFRRLQTQTQRVE